MPGTPVAALEPLGVVSSNWVSANKNVNLILESMQPITSLREDVEQFAVLASGLLARSDELVASVTDNGGTPEQVYLATRQLMLIERIVKNMKQTLEGGDGAQVVMRWRITNTVRRLRAIAAALVPLSIGRGDVSDSRATRSSES